MGNKCLITDEYYLKKGTTPLDYAFRFTKNMPTATPPKAISTLIVNGSPMKIILKIKPKIGVKNPKEDTFETK